jgi:hypothetical protein
MKHAVLSLPDELVEDLDRFGRSQEPPREPGEIVQTAVREYLAAYGYTAPARTLSITPAEQGSGVTDLSLHHDRYFAE